MSFESENVGEVFRSRMPTFDSDASIQEAIKVYHFGVNDFSGGVIPRDSIEGHLSAISASVVANANAIINLGTTFIEEMSLTDDPNEIYPQTSNVVPLTIKGAVNQVVPLQRWVNSSNTPQAVIFNDGSISAQGYATVGSVPGSSPTTTALNVTIASATNKGVVVRAAASQTGNLQEWQNSSESVLARVDNVGKIYSNNSEVVNLIDSQTILNKTLTSPTINSPSVIGGTISSATSITLTGPQNNAARARNIIFSTISPTPEQGSNGDLWVKYVN
jgi:hypothetical protein